MKKMLGNPVDSVGSIAKDSGIPSKVFHNDPMSSDRSLRFPRGNETLDVLLRDGKVPEVRIMVARCVRTRLSFLAQHISLLATLDSVESLGGECRKLWKQIKFSGMTFALKAVNVAIIERGAQRRQPLVKNSNVLG